MAIVNFYRDLRVEWNQAYKSHSDFICFFTTPLFSDRLKSCKSLFTQKRRNQKQVGEQPSKDKRKAVKFDA